MVNTSGPNDLTHTQTGYDQWAPIYDRDGNPLHAELLNAGAKIDYGPCDQPYGCREFGIQDLDNHDIAFGQDLSIHPYKP